MIHLAHAVPSPGRTLALLALVLAAGVATQARAQPSIQDEVRSLVQPLVQPMVALPASVRGQARAQVELGRLDPSLKLAPCRRIEPRWPDQARAWGRTHVALRCVDGEKPWQVYLPVTVQVFAPALVPARALAAGTVLTRADFGLAEVDWAAGVRPPLVDPAEAEGRTLARAVRPGQALVADDLRRRQWFAAGDPVQVVARGAGFAVSGEGQALGPGVEGQPVRVRTESGRILTGHPVGERRIEVLL